MNGWTVDLSETARKELRALDKGAKQAAGELIEELRELGPALVPSLRMRAYKDTWRARFHQERYRMNYQVSRSRNHILVKHIRIRAIAYDRLKH